MPWTVAHLASLSMGFPRQEFWSGLQFPSQGDLLEPGIKPTSPELACGSLLLSYKGSPVFRVLLWKSHNSDFLDGESKLYVACKMSPKCISFLICHTMSKRWKEHSLLSPVLCPLAWLYVKYSGKLIILPILNGWRFLMMKVNQFKQRWQLFKDVLWVKYCTLFWKGWFLVFCSI